MSTSGCSLKAVPIAFADGPKCQRKKRIKNGSEAIAKMQLPLTKLSKKTLGREGSLQEKVQVYYIKFEVTIRYLLNIFRCKVISWRFESRMNKKNPG